VRTARLAGSLLILAACSPAAAPDVAYDGQAFTATGWKGAEPPQGWAGVLSVYASPDPAMPPMLGRYERQGSTLVFRPAYPPALGLSLRAVYRPSAGAPIERTFAAPTKAATAPARVETVFPTTGVLPANQLKFYIQFSRPMSRGQAWDHLRLVDAAGREVEEAFVRIDEELWDPASRRLTVLFEPGRIKRGVGPNMEIGPPLVAGRRYTLVVDPAWKDADGAPLSAGFGKDFAVGPAVRLPVLPGEWRLTPPQAGTRQPLVVAFPRPLDAALLQHALAVKAGAPIEGVVAVSDQETRWAFTPAQPWQAGRYTLTVDAWLEDLAGNRVGRVFDVDTSRPAPAPTPLALSFTVAG
jgi:hypothetical protein